MSALIRSKWWPAFWFVYSVAGLTYVLLRVGGIEGTALTITFAFLAGSNLNSLLIADPARKLADGWRDLYYEAKGVR